MPNFKVTWEIDIDADTATEAAEEALSIQRRESTATVFVCKNMETGEESTIDLTYEEENE